MAWLLGLTTYFGWGTGDIFGVYAARKLGAYRATALIYIVGFCLASLYIPFAWDEVKLITPGLALLNIFLGTGYMFGNLLLNEGFKRSSASIIGIIVQSFPAIVLVLSTVIFNDPITSRQVLWIMLIFVGVFFCTIEKEDLKNHTLFSDSGVKLALYASAIFSVYFTFYRVFEAQYGWFWPNYLSFLTFPIALYLGKRLFGYKDSLKLRIKERKASLAAGASAVTLRTADIAFNYGLSQGFATIVAPLAGSAPTFFVTLSYFIYRDPVTTQQKLGIGISVVGLVMLSFFS